MQVVQVAIGKFHHFHLARYLSRNGCLKAIYCGYPWSKLQKESIPRDQVRTFPWFQAPYMALGRIPGFQVSDKIRRNWEWISQTTFARHVARTLPECDALVALSASGLEAGRKIQERGGVWVCDRGSTHIRYQHELLRDEHNRWNMSWVGIDPRMIEREEVEYENSDYITIPSEFNFKSFIEQGVPESKLRKISYGANIARFSPTGERDSERFIVLFVGSISLRKGIPYLLQAFEKFHHPRKELWIVGMKSPGIEPILNRFLKTNVKFLGLVPNDRLASIYSQAHAFVLPSIEEGLAVVQGEALACGCPVIATEHTGASDLFHDKVEGFVVPIRDPEAITGRLTQLADSPKLWDEMSKAAIDRVRSIGGWDHYGGAYESFLRHAIGDKSR